MLFFTHANTAVYFMENIFQDISLIIVFSSILSAVALYLKQPIILGYIAAGILIGPSGLGWVYNVDFINGSAKLGITLLLFLAGLELHPRAFAKNLSKLSLLTIISSLCFLAFSFIVARIAGFLWVDAMVIGIAMMFSSTILVIKLLPTITLHQKDMGAICIAILILQDLIAIFALIGLQSTQAANIGAMLRLPLSLTGLLLFTFAAERFTLRPVMQYCSRFHETLYTISIGWCLGISAVAHYMGLSYEVGAFIAGLTLAQSPLASFLFQGLEFVRDLFLVLFFFVLGSKLHFVLPLHLWFMAIALAITLVLIKPQIYRRLLEHAGTNRKTNETAWRLGQGSEFGLIIAAKGIELQCISNHASQFIQFTILITMIISSYLVVKRYPSPLATDPKLKRN